MTKGNKPTDAEILDALFRESPSAVYLKDSQSRYLRIGKGFTEISGFSEDVIGKSDIDNLGAEVAEQYMNNDRIVFETGERLVVEETFDVPDFGTKYFHTVKIPVTNADNAVTAVLGVSTDITHLRSIENALSEISTQTTKKTGNRFIDALSHQLSRVLQADYLMIATINEDKTIATTLALLKGQSPVPTIEYALKGTPCEQVIAHEVCIYPRNLQQLFPTDIELVNMEVHAYVGIALSDMAETPIGLISALYRKPLKDTRFISELLQIFAGRISAEIAREKKEQELLALTDSLEAKIEQRTTELSNTLAELESFSYTVSHDLRAPLRSLSGMTELLTEHLGDHLDTQATHYVSRIKHACANMNQQIDALLKLTRLGKQSINWAPIKLSEICDDVLTQLRSTYNDISADVYIQSGLKCFGDKALIETVIMNLLQNAFKYRHTDRKLQISVSGKIENRFLAVCVADNGIGFDVVYADKLFKPFSRLHNNPDLEGDGIGLASIAKIINRHGGVFSATAQLNRGAQFFVSLPRERPPQFPAT